MRGTELFALGPGFECGLIGPDRMRGIKDFSRLCWPFEHMEFHETRHLVQMAFPPKPERFERSGVFKWNGKAVHSDKHLRSPRSDPFGCGSVPRNPRQSHLIRTVGSRARFVKKLPMVWRRA